jgi:hypothetical protein
MLPRVRWRLTYANVMSTVAVFVALGGGAYAAVKITGRDIVDESVTGKDIKNSSIQKADLGRALVGTPGPTGPSGVAGPAGTGTKGATGPTGPGGQDLTGPSVAFSEALDAVSTSSASTVELGGPSVTVTVGPSGLVEVYGSSRGKPDTFGPSALVSLGTTAPTSQTIMSFTTDTQFTARNTEPGNSGGNGSTTPGGWLVLRLPPGQQTISMYYRMLNGGTGTWDERRLWARPVN